ncbi:MAG: helix-turn-helix domain-containing protein [Candidatus Thermoplasmatota archaeon]|nr:helix-turn-helix domain-containing protein [Candidatus Thermoplasmatota archaeon]
MVLYEEKTIEDVKDSMWLARERLAEKLASEIILSKNPSQTFRSWRDQFSVSQQDLAQEIGVSPSQLSDYEKGRRKNPSLNLMKRMIEGLIKLDVKRGANTIKKYSMDLQDEAILDMAEFTIGVNPSVFMDVIQGTLQSGTGDDQDDYIRRPILGYSIIDSILGILRFSSLDYMRIYGRSTERALLFTKVAYGRSPMIAVRAHPIKPAMVVYIQPEKVDPLAIKLARLERIPLITTHLSVDDISKRLRKLI